MQSIFARNLVVMIVAIFSGIVGSAVFSPRSASVNKPSPVAISQAPVSYPVHEPTPLLAPPLYSPPSAPAPAAVAPATQKAPRPLETPQQFVAGIPKTATSTQLP